MNLITWKLKNPESRTVLAKPLISREEDAFSECESVVRERKAKIGY